MTTLLDLDTPSLVLDVARLRANTRAMRERAAALGVALRPHLKTCKSAEVAKAALEGLPLRGTVSTLREAEYFFDAGFTDLVYAVGIVPGRLERAAALMDRGCGLTLLTDNAEAAAAVALQAERTGVRFRVLIEIDCGGRRGGVDAAGDELMALAELLGGEGLLAGVLTHAGQSYDLRDPDAMAAMAETERAAVVRAAERIRAAGFDCPVVSVGSTPTATFARDLAGVTEMRPGVYVFQDLYQAGIGVCGLGDIAVSVLATVIRHRPEDNTLVIDAGALALSKDRSTAAIRGPGHAHDHPGDCGYGLVCDVATGTPIGGLHVVDAHQEHGIVTEGAPLPYDRLPVGAKVRVLPNHACMTAAAYDAYRVIDPEREDPVRVIDTWPRCNGW